MNVELQKHYQYDAASVKQALNDFSSGMEILLQRLNDASLDVFDVLMKIETGNHELLKQLVDTHMAALDAILAKIIEDGSFLGNERVRKLVNQLAIIRGI